MSRGDSPNTTSSTTPNTYFQTTQDKNGKSSFTYKNLKILCLGVLSLKGLFF